MVCIYTRGTQDRTTINTYNNNTQQQQHKQQQQHRTQKGNTTEHHNTLTTTNTTYATQIHVHLCEQHGMTTD